MKNMSSKKLSVISLGCDKNRVDTENMLYYLSSGDYTVTNDYATAEIIIINTCAFIESARKEAIETILGMASLKKIGSCKKLIVTGCLPQKYRTELIEDLPEVDAFLGIDEYEKIRACIENDATVCEKSYKRVLTTPPHYAFFKIADGCDNFCTYCTIPSIRGRYRSRDIESLYVEAKDLVEKGVKELILVAQDVTSYGKDLYGKPSLIELLRRLSTLDVTWIRLMYCYPELVSDELIAEVSSNPKIAKYMDVPMQHVADSVLKRMNRKSNGRQLRELVNKLYDNKIAVRTTFMVGFPGETQEDFDELVSFVKENPLCNIGIFAYSKEEGTPSAKLKGHLTKSVKKKRVSALGEAFYERAIQTAESMIGSTVEVIYEDIDERGYFVGRTQYDAPEIDKTVYFTGKFADVGNIYKVKIIDHDFIDLIGEIVE